MSDIMTDRLRIIAEPFGADVFGVADAEGFKTEDYQGNPPHEMIKECRSIIVIGTSMPRGCVDPLPCGRAEYTNTLMVATATIRITALRVAKELEKEGYLATLLPTEGSEFGYWYVNREKLKSGVSIKFVSYLAGISQYRANHLILTQDHGARVRLAAVITDAPLNASSLMGDLVTKECKDCLGCVDVCPAAALHPDGSIDQGGAGTTCLPIWEG